MTDITNKYVRLNSGNVMPLLGYGTYQIPVSIEGQKMIEDAISAGYKLLDCASFYLNEEIVGNAVAKFDRSELFIVSKVWNDAIFKGRAAVRASCMESLRRLRCEYIDLFLVHWPVPGKHIEAYNELECLKREGYIRDIGVSNYTIEDLLELLKSGIKVVPAVNQIEINPFLFRRVTLDFMNTQGIIPMSYRGLRNASGVTDPLVLKIANAHNVSPAQVLGRWLVQQNICHIPKSSKLERMKSNADVFSFNLSDQDIMDLGNLTTRENLCIFREHYLPRIVRDTPLEVPRDLDFTID